MVHIHKTSVTIGTPKQGGLRAGHVIFVMRSAESCCGNTPVTKAAKPGTRMFRSFPFPRYPVPEAFTTTTISLHREIARLQSSVTYVFANDSIIAPPFDALDGLSP